MDIHHIGYVVKNIDKNLKNFPHLKTKKILIDNKQNAKIGIFKNLKNKVLIELIQPLNKKSYTWNFLQNGGGIHHICYNGISMSNIQLIVKKNKLFHILGPIDALLFKKKVIFYMTKDKQIIEYIL